LNRIAEILKEVSIYPRKYTPGFRMRFMSIAAGRIASLAAS
jgi:hypothetical protein